MLKIASETVLMNGYSNTNIRELMDATGLGKDSFPNYFKSKEDMGINVLEAFILKPWILLGGTDKPENYVIGNLSTYLDLVSQTLNK